MPASDVRRPAGFAPGWLPASALLASALLASALLASALLAGGCSEPPPPWSGYAEGDYVYVASPLAGRLDALAVAAGQPVTRGALLFRLDAEVERAARDEAQARLDAALAQLADAGKGRRADEVAVTEAQLAQARAQATLARSDIARQRQLVDSGFVAQARLDDALAALRQAQGRVDELSAALRVARLPARTDALDAAQAQVDAAQQALRQSDWRAEQKTQRAPADATVTDTFFRAGEYVPAGRPVLALLPPANLKARFYVPQGDVGRIAAGQPVVLSCDGCGEPIAARITRIADGPEYTPPVLYSAAQRAKLVFLVEARPAAQDAHKLHPGQPLDVRPAGVEATRAPRAGSGS